METTSTSLFSAQSKKLSLCFLSEIFFAIEKKLLLTLNQDKKYVNGTNYFRFCQIELSIQIAVLKMAVL